MPILVYRLALGSGVSRRETRKCASLLTNNKYLTFFNRYPLSTLLINVVGQLNIIFSLYHIE